MHTWLQNNMRDIQAANAFRAFHRSIFSPSQQLKNAFIKTAIFRETGLMKHVICASFSTHSTIVLIVVLHSEEKCAYLMKSHVGCLWYLLLTLQIYIIGEMCNCSSCYFWANIAFFLGAVIDYFSFL